MTEKESTPDRDRTDDRTDGVRRRTFIAASGGVGATVFAGCTSEGSADGPNDGGQRDETQANGSTGAVHDGNFRLLISDMPADIGDFDRLDVTFDSARIFDGGEDERSDDEDDDDQGETGDDQDDADDEPEGAADDEGEESADEAEGEDDATGENDGDSEADGVERRRGFYVLDLEDETVDLTEVIGDRAVSVFEGELSPGTYEKIELHVSEVEGIVDGEQATVKVPSEKLQITHLFEISADEPVGFVFDINVVKRGKGSDYNLKPVISKSGVAGEDVEVVDEEDEEDDEQEAEEHNDEQGDDGENDRTENGDSDAGERDGEDDESGESRDDGGDE